ncbi:MAG: hypothetical protein GC185_10835 [Alphaproteobacteria bacterium]|nr:hypothetical protein [Alphaproteobacteria bacterium]
MNDFDPHRARSPFPIIDEALRLDSLRRKQERRAWQDGPPRGRGSGGILVSAWSVAAGLFGLATGIMAAGSVHGIGGLGIFLSGIACGLIAMLTVAAICYSIKAVLSLLKKLFLGGGKKDGPAG